tara:strand:+ start:1426 stop:1608 length:183 start_codon:yes stop_codon:yes gene_type:complete
MKKEKDGGKVEVNHSKFINKDGYKTGGVEIEMTNPQETQTFAVRGQKGMLAEKKRNAKLF